MNRHTLLLPLMLMLPLGASAQGIEFMDNRPMAEVLAKAKAEQKMVFVDCYTSWCGPCKVLARDVFPLKVAGDYFNPRFVSLKLDMEKGEGPAMAKKWDVGAYPTLTFLNADGTVLFQTVGSRTAEQLVSTVDSLLKHHQPSDAEQRYNSGERTPAVVEQYIGELKEKRKTNTMAQVAADFATANRELLLTDSTAQQLMATYVRDPHNEGFRYAYEHRQELPQRIVEAMEQTWKSYTKTYYIMGQGDGLGIDEQGMQQYYEFMKANGVANALTYYMNYKLPASFLMKDKRMMLECLQQCRSLQGVAQGQINMALTELSKQQLTEAERKQYETLKDYYSNNTQQKK